MSTGRNKVTEAEAMWRALPEAQRIAFYEDVESIKSYAREAQDSTYDAAIALLRAAAEPEVQASAGYCDVTGNPLGTDTWAEGYSCECASCQAWLKTRQSTFDFGDKLQPIPPYQGPWRR